MIVHVHAAGVGSGWPEPSVDLTWKVCVPTVSREYVCGDEQEVHPAASRLHSK